MIDSQGRKRYRFQFRLVSLFWITLVVASFFWGRSSDQAWERLRQYWAGVFPPRVTVPVGNSTVINSDFPLTRIQIDNPSVCRIVVVNPTDYRITGKNVGNTRVTVWPKDSAKPKTIRVMITPRKSPPTENARRAADGGGRL